MKISKKLALMAAVAGFVCVGPAFAQDATGPDEAVDAPDVLFMVAEGPEDVVAMANNEGAWRRPSPFAELGLTDDQYEKMFAIRRDAAGKDAAKYGQLISAEMQVHDLMLQPDLDRSKIVAVQNTINGLKTDIANDHLESRIAAMAVLTPDQRRELRRRMLEHIAGFGGRRHHGGGEGMGGPGGGMGMGGHGGGKMMCPPGECKKK